MAAVCHRVAPNSINRPRSLTVASLRSLFSLITHLPKGRTVESLAKIKSNFQFVRLASSHSSLTDGRCFLALICLLWIGAASGDGVIETPSVSAEQPTYPGAYIEIIKSEQLLRVRRGDVTYREYAIAHGRGDRGAKEILGDKKTPEGIYRIVGINDSERFHLFLRLNYPNVKDAFYGLKNKTISRNEFDRIIDALRRGRLPPQNTALGGAIGIHGVGVETEKKLKIHANMNWTEGCVALTNAEVNELRNMIHIGTEVVIKP